MNQRVIAAIIQTATEAAIASLPAISLKEKSEYFFFLCPFSNLCREVAVEITFIFGEEKCGEEITIGVEITIEGEVSKEPIFFAEP